MKKLLMDFFLRINPRKIYKEIVEERQSSLDKNIAKARALIIEFNERIASVDKTREDLIQLAFTRPEAKSDIVNLYDNILQLQTALRFKIVRLNEELHLMLELKALESMTIEELHRKALQSIALLEKQQLA